MSSENLFNLDQQKSSSNKVIAIVAGVLVLLVGAAFLVWQFAFPKPQKAKVDPYSDSKLRDSIVMMLAQPRFSGEVFRQQVIGNAKMPWFSIPKKEFYFSLPESSQEEFDAAISKFIVDKNKIEFGAESDGKFVFPDVSLKKTPENGYFFKTTLENIKFDNKDLVFPFKRATYNLSLRELVDFANNSRIYGGMMRTDTTLKKDGKTIVFANHGIMVSKPDEPSLQRLIAEILKNVPNNEKREAKIQALLDFVTNEIEYDYSEALNGETLKRPDETLMSGRSDCSNKTILMASFLEQIGEDYILLYCPQHITVGVPQGDFPNENNLAFKWEGKTFMIAETTLPNFVIGKTRVEDAKRLTSIEYVQRPKNKNFIFAADSLKQLEFR